MKYLKRFNEALSRREVASSMVDDLKSICIDLEHDYDFITYIFPFEKEYNEDYDDGTPGSIVKNTRPSNISKNLKDGNFYISFDLDLNKVSRDFEDPKRLEILDGIKTTLERLKKYMQSYDYKFDIVGKTYEDVRNGEFKHEKGYWGQKSFSPFNEKRFKIMEQIKFRIDLRQLSD